MGVIVHARVLHGFVTQQTAAPAPATTEKDPWPALFALCLGFFMILVDSTIVSVATPAIIEDLHADDVTVYAYARVGYHRSLDMLRRNGWKGHGPVPWEHEPNRGFLRALAALATAAGRIGEAPEAQRCSEFLRDSSPAGYDALLG